LIREYAAAAGLGEVSPSTLRRTYAQTVWKKTGDLSQVANALGHTRLKSTIRYITCLLEDTSRDTEIKEKSSANVFPKAVGAQEVLTGVDGTVR
jgi:integrase